MRKNDFLSGCCGDRALLSESEGESLQLPSSLLDWGLTVVERVPGSVTLALSSSLSSCWSMVAAFACSVQASETRVRGWRG